MMDSALLIIDDDEEIRTQLKWALQKDYKVVFAANRADAMSVFKAQRPMVTMLDLGLPPRPNDPEEGLVALSEILALDRLAKVIVVSGQGEKANALRAVGVGAYDFLSKPFDLEELVFLLQRCFHVAKLEREFYELQKSVQPDTFEGMMGTSPQMQGVFGMIRKVATSSAPVLLLGESGTGKEMAALAIHRRSGRKTEPFITINCSAIPESLLESELFGHEKGSFTGAHTQRKGLLESAAGGTLFLDEIGDLPGPIQVKLLRFLQDQTFMRVGGRQEIEVDARIITATNVDLKQAVAHGVFREDLYFRLAVVVIQMPPLRERGDDVALVAKSFLDQFAAQNRKKNLIFAPDALRALYGYSWPGNVRELQNRMQRAVIMADGRCITAEDIELSGASCRVGSTLKEARETTERELVQRALKRHSGKIAPAAAELGISRPTLYELLEKLGLGKRAAGIE